ncbi:unnamed protein product [Sphagnum balticum]
MCAPAMVLLQSSSSSSHVRGQYRAFFFGPQGLDKMIVDDVERFASPTMVIEIKFRRNNPQEIVELLKRANELIKMKVHPTNIISGFKIAAKESCRYIEDTLAVTVESLGDKGSPADAHSDQEGQDRLFGLHLNKFRLQMGIQVLVDDPKNLEKVRQKECDILKSRVMKIINAGANVILTKMGIDDLASKYMVENGCIGLRRVEKGDLHRIAKLTGATVISTLATPEGEEAFDPSFLGECDEVAEEAVGITISSLQGL